MAEIQHEIGIARGHLRLGPVAPDKGIRPAAPHQIVEPTAAHQTICPAGAKDRIARGRADGIFDAEQRFETVGASLRKTGAQIDGHASAAGGAVIIAGFVADGVGAGAAAKAVLPADRDEAVIPRFAAVIAFEGGDGEQVIAQSTQNRIGPVRAKGPEPRADISVAPIPQRDQVALFGAVHHGIMAQPHVNGIAAAKVVRAVQIDSIIAAPHEKGDFDIVEGKPLHEFIRSVVEGQRAAHGNPVF